MIYKVEVRVTLKSSPDWTFHHTCMQRLCGGHMLVCGLNWLRQAAARAAREARIQQHGRSCRSGDLVDDQQQSDFTRLRVHTTLHILQHSFVMGI